MSPEFEVKLEDIRPLTTHEFDQFRRLAYDTAGISLQTGKEQLVSARLSKKMRELRIRSYEEYYRFVTRDTTGQALITLIDALTTNHTSFFREAAHFEFLRTNILPALRGRERISIWCAASSTGEEPYSMVFSILDELGMEALPRLNILATDISTRVLAVAQRGAYTAERFRDFPPQQLRRYLLRGEGKWRDWYMVRKEIRAVVRFERLNLMDQFSHATPFPVIFCRNVMIYFDRQTQESLVNRLANVLEPGGHLFIGHAESLNGLKQPLQYVRPAIYIKPRPGSGILSKGFSRA
ncbi:MAG: protein-glutamate O-methyltransferase CheR [Acidobacteriaceae bacterium]|nr:protein-glutamate O-methyltransferase CheR [Acidobacteriaceae bacterium]